MDTLSFMTFPPWGRRKAIEGRAAEASCREGGRPRATAFAAETGPSVMMTIRLSVCVSPTILKDLPRDGSIQMLDIPGLVW